MTSCENDSKINDIEKSMIKLETTLSGFAINMSDKMGGMAAQMSAMSETLTSLAVAEEKINQLEVDMRNIANIHRNDISELHDKINTTNGKMNIFHEDHTLLCNTKTTNLKQHMEQEGDARLSFGLKSAFSGMGVLWGITSLIFWALFNSWNVTANETNKIVKDNQLMMRTYSEKFKTIEKRLDYDIKIQKKYKVDK